MIKGLYAAASAMLAGLTRQQALAHNVANMDTPGFKQVLLSLEDFTDTPVLTPPGGTNQGSPLRYIGDLGLGVDTSPKTTDFTAGALKFTGQPLDLAIQGNGFFHIQTPDGEGYTRDGRFTQDAGNQLVTVDGYQVLDEGGGPISLPEGAASISVHQDGTILADGEEVGKLGLAIFENPEEELTRLLPNVFTASGSPAGEGVATVAQGYLEMANVNPAELMTQMAAVSRAYEAAQKMVQTQDELLAQTISTLGQL